MSNDQASERNAGSGGNWFTTTRWSVVLAAHGAAPGAHEALETLCRTYWPPLYSYVRRQGHTPEEAQDLTQDFFAHLLQNRVFGHADATRGKFRAFLLTALQHFLVSARRKRTSAKRGGPQPILSLDTHAAEQQYTEELADLADPKTVYEKRWALAMMERVLAALRQEYVAADKAALFDRLVDRLWGETTDEPYRELAPKLGLSEDALKQCAHRLRERCRELLRREVADTVARPEEIDEELRYLVNILKR